MLCSKYDSSLALLIVLHSELFTGSAACVGLSCKHLSTLVSQISVRMLDCVEPCFPLR
jgi:hypothetical protein